MTAGNGAPNGVVSAMTQEQATAAGKQILWGNAAMAVVVGLGLISLPLFTWRHWAAGLTIGLLYSNVFEYCYHRFLLHGARGAPAARHLKHHTSWGNDDEGLHANFGDSPLSVAILLSVNSLPFFLLEWLFHPGIGAGVAIAFVIYFIVAEQVHWRIHMGGLPACLHCLRLYHLDHHAGRRENYNVFLPLCDWLVSRKQKSNTLSYP